MPIFFKKEDEVKYNQGKLKGELERLLEPSDQNIKPSAVKKRVKDIDLKDSMGRTQSQLLYNFACELCEQYRRQEHQNFHKLNGLGLEPNKLYRICDTCIDTGRANIVKPRNDDYDPIK